jgi:hypothetical protein
MTGRRKSQRKQRLSAAKKWSKLPPHYFEMIEQGNIS